MRTANLAGRLVLVDGGAAVDVAELLVRLSRVCGCTPAT